MILKILIFFFLLYFTYFINIYNTLNKLLYKPIILCFISFLYNFHNNHFIKDKMIYLLYFLYLYFLITTYIYPFIYIYICK